MCANKWVLIKVPIINSSIHQFMLYPGQDQRTPEADLGSTGHEVGIILGWDARPS